MCKRILKSDRTDLFNAMKKSSLSVILISLLLTGFFSSCSGNELDSNAPETIQYNLTVTASSGGSVTPEAGTYDAGTVITIVATSEGGYVFDRWQGTDNDNKPNPCGKGRRLDEFSRNCRITLTLESNRLVQAFFQAE